MKPQWQSAGGDAADIMWENEAMDYVVPEEGSNLWFDNFVIPKTAKNIEGAHEFINFMLDLRFLHRTQNMSATLRRIKKL